MSVRMTNDALKIARRALFIELDRARESEAMLLDAAQKAADTFADFDQALSILGHNTAAKAARVAKDYLREVVENIILGAEK